MKAESDIPKVCRGSGGNGRRTERLTLYYSPCAFSLVELLVVIGIIAVLIAILLPALSQRGTRRGLSVALHASAKVAAAFLIYGEDNKGALPNLTSPPNGGVNLWDQSVTLYDTFVNSYKFPHEMMFCPLSPEELTDINNGAWLQDIGAGYDRLGYCFWVPYLTTSGTIPPTPGDGQGFQVNGTAPIAGPVRLGEPLAQTNPIATDVVFTYAPVFSPDNTTDLSRMSVSKVGSTSTPSTSETVATSIRSMRRGLMGM